MNPMDCKQAQNVWSRVMAAQTAAPCTNAEKAPELPRCAEKSGKIQKNWKKPVAKEVEDII